MSVCRVNVNLCVALSRVESIEWLNKTRILLCKDLHGLKGEHESRGKMGNISLFCTYISLTERNW